MLVSVAKATEAASVLGVELAGLTAASLNSAYRTKAKECHPDHHGTAKLPVWARVSWAKECLDQWVEKHPATVQDNDSTEICLTGDCRACGGSGRVRVGSGRFGAPLTMQCVICRGLGTVEPEEIDND